MGIEILMPYPINQRVHQFNSIQSVPVSFGLWDTALKFLSPGPRNDVTDHLDIPYSQLTLREAPLGLALTVQTLCKLQCTAMQSTFISVWRYFSLHNSLLKCLLTVSRVSVVCLKESIVTLYSKMSDK